jgi:acetylornithine deacetylase/succinyl-diaminopimelate desuccinylase-like protein
VWGKFHNTEHQPNEYNVIDDMVGDARIYAHVFGQHD